MTVDPGALSGVSLGDRVAVVSGGCAPLNIAATTALAARGARVMLLGSPLDGPRELAATLDRERDHVLPHVADLLDEAAVAEAVDIATASLGQVNLAVFSGIDDPPMVADRTLPAAWQRMADASRAGFRNVIGAVAPQLVAAAARGIADLVLAVPTTGGAPSRLDGLRAEFGPRGVRVAAIEIGPVSERAPDTTPPSAGKTPPAGRIGRRTSRLRAADVADLIAYVVSQPDHVVVSRLVVASAE